MKGISVVFRNFRCTPIFEGSMMFHDVPWALSKDCWASHWSFKDPPSAATTLTIVVLDRPASSRLHEPKTSLNNSWKHKSPELKNWSPGMSGNFRRFPGNFRRFPGNFRRFPGNIRAMFFAFCDGFHWVQWISWVWSNSNRCCSQKAHRKRLPERWRHFPAKKTAPMVDSQVICFEMRGRSRIKFTLGRNRSICLQEGKSAPKENFRFSLGRSASKEEEPLLPLAEEISYL